MMKRLLPSIASTVLIGTTALAQVPNGGFEDWTSAGDYNEPDGWVTFNSLTFMLGGVLCCEEGAPAPQGDTYVHLTTRNIDGVGVVPGLMFTAASADAAEGFPHTERSSTLTGQWMFDVVGGDMGVVTLTLTRWNPETQQREDVGSGAAMAMGTQATWVPFSMDIEYTSALDPDTATIYMISSTNAASAGSTLSVDDLAFGASTGVRTVKGGTFSLAPSPATDVLRVTSTEGIAGVSVMDMSGREVRTIATNGLPAVLDVAALPAGTYVARVRFTDGRLTARPFIKQ
ncbi:MAG: T9SS type A sorting domain-containing protein [Bacteroidetes bacterium]|nr:T9SS type A sorting domain-containing protein [Bacteroidota bacterium]